jgi:cytochrome P450
MTPNTALDEQVKYDPFTQQMLDDPYPTYQAMLERAPVLKNEERGFWTLCRFDDVQAAARTWQTFSSDEGVDLDYMAKLMCGPGDFLDYDPPRHGQLRDIIKRRFTPKAFEQLTPKIQVIVDELLDELVERGGGDIVADLAGPIPIRVVTALLGFPQEDLPKLTDLQMKSITRTPGELRLPKVALDATAELRDYFADAAALRRRNPTDDVITDMVTRKAGDRYMTEPEIIGMCFLLWIAGFDTTRSLIENGLQRLDEFPDQRAILVREPERMREAVEELLRFESPVQNAARTTQTEVTMHDVTIPAGARIALLFGAANRDPRRWENPDKLDFTRESKRNLAFGEGIHHCLGAPLARLEGRIALKAFLERVPEYQIEYPLERIPIQNLRLFKRLPISF